MFSPETGNTDQIVAVDLRPGHFCPEILLAVAPPRRMDSRRLIRARRQEVPRVDFMNSLFALHFTIMYTS
jgi:hypothetical protein